MSAVETCSGCSLSIHEPHSESDTVFISEISSKGYGDNVTHGFKLGDKSLRIHASLLQGAKGPGDITSRIIVFGRLSREYFLPLQLPSLKEQPFFEHGLRAYHLHRHMNQEFDDGAFTSLWWQIQHGPLYHGLRSDSRRRSFRSSSPQLERSSALSIPLTSLVYNPSEDDGIKPFPTSHLRNELYPAPYLWGINIFGSLGYGWKDSCEDVTIYNLESDVADHIPTSKVFIAAGVIEIH